jgi:peptide/nickel transport system substrate-binding protein
MYKCAKLGVLIPAIMVTSLLLSACATPASEVVEREVTRVVQETVVEKETVVETVVQKETVVEELVVTATPAAAQGPTVGGTLVWALSGEPDSLDAQNTTSAVSDTVMPFIGAALVTKNPEGKYVGYLAESWETSEDGLVWDFKLKQGITFHNGDPFTAHDYAWTLQRALNPEVATGAAGQILGTVTSVEALDDYTLRLNLSEPFFPILESLTSAGYLMPLSQRAVEEAGDEYGRHPVSVGPYRFKEWQTGEKIVLERNPDFNWGPAFAHQGPWYIENLEFRIVPEYATVVAALEAEEIDYGDLQPKDVSRIQDTGQFQIFEPLLKGLQPYVSLNVSQPPFDDIRVRKAFNLAVDKEAMIKTVARGQGIPQYGPMSPSVTGYWPGVEYIGYHYDLEQAKALMEEAGYTYNADGMLEKDGQPFHITLKTRSGMEDLVKTAEVLQAQYKELGVDVSIEQQEYGVNVADVVSGNYEASVFRYLYNEADILWLAFHSKMMDVMNLPRVTDPKLDELLDRTRTTVDPEARQEAVDEAQRYIVEQALIVPIYTPKNFIALNTRVKDALFSEPNGYIHWDDAYISTE